MSMSTGRIGFLFVLLASLSLFAGQKTVFNDDRPETKALAFWRLTHDPRTRHHTVYHHQDPFSPSGRYLLYIIAQDHPERRGPGEPESVVAVYDFFADREVWRSTTAATWPLWANHSDVLYFADGTKGRRQNVWQVLIPSGATTLICSDARNAVTGISPDDRWLYWTYNAVYRVAAEADSSSEVQWAHPEAPAVSSSLVNHNPVYPVYNVRQNPRHLVRTVRWNRDYPPRMLVHDAGLAFGAAMAPHEQGHGAWRGDGAYLIIGDGFLRGRLWHEPFPGAMLAYSNTKAHDPSPCGRSGQWTCTTDGINDCLKRFDWRTTDTTLIAYSCSIIHQEQENDRDMSGAYDSDAFGSPDGTKIVFSTNYQIDRFPATQIVRSAGDAVEVLSTAGFPDSGYLSIGVGVMSYTSRTANTFIGLEPHAFNSRYWPKLVSAGFTVSDFAGRTDLSAGNVLAEQYSTDVYIAVVKRPDSPVLQRDTKGVVLFPGGNHREICGYDISIDGRPLSDSPWDGQTELLLPAGDRLQAAAVEWSGLRSESCAALPLAGARVLRLERQRPAHFAQLTRSWSIQAADGSITPLQEPLENHLFADTVAELHDRDGTLVAREYYHFGERRRRDELTPDGRATLTKEFLNGRLHRRIIRNPQGNVVRVETLDEQGRLAKIEGGMTEEHPSRENRGVNVEIYRDGEPERRVLMTSSGPLTQVARDGRWENE